MEFRKLFKRPMSGEPENAHWVSMESGGNPS